MGSASSLSLSYTTTKSGLGCTHIYGCFVFTADFQLSGIILVSHRVRLNSIKVAMLKALRQPLKVAKENSQYIVKNI